MTSSYILSIADRVKFYAIQEGLLICINECNITYKASYTFEFKINSLIKTNHYDEFRLLIDLII